MQAHQDISTPCAFLATGTVQRSSLLCLSIQPLSLITVHLPKIKYWEINSPSLLNSSRSVQHSLLTCYNILCHSINKSCTLITTVHHTDPRHTDYTFTKGWSPLSLRTDRDTHDYTEPKRLLLKTCTHTRALVQHIGYQHTMCFPCYRYTPEELSALPLDTATKLPEKVRLFCSILLCL